MNEVIDYSKIAFDKTLYVGTVCEVMAENAINENKDNLCAKLVKGTTILLDAVEAGLSDPYDTRLYLGKEQKERAWYSMETKAAENGGKFPNFFAETISMKSNCYPEYLVHPPTFMCWVDSLSNDLYFYDAEVLIAYLKEKFQYSFPNKYKTAKGLLFGCEDVSKGFICKVSSTLSFSETAEKHKGEIRRRMNKGKVAPFHKMAPGLPNL